MPTGVYERKKKGRKIRGWTPEHRAAYEAAIRAKGRKVVAQPGATAKQKKEAINARVRELRAQKNAAKLANVQPPSAVEFPLDAIPERAPKQVRTAKAPVAVLNGFANGHGKHAALVHAEYDIATDQMTLVLGKLRLPFRVKV